MLQRISYPQEYRKCVREAVNGLKSNLTTDHCEVHKRNLSVSQDMLFGRGFESPQVHRSLGRSTFWQYERKTVGVAKNEDPSGWDAHNPGLNGLDGNGK